MNIIEEVATLKTMLTPKFILIAYWLMILASVFSGLSMFTYNAGGGLFFMIAGVLAARVTCELMIVLFNIHDSLQDIRQSTKTRSEAGKQE